MDTVQVAVRIRPMVENELQRGCQEAIVRVPNQPQVILHNESFTYNYVFDSYDSQEKVFNDAILPMLDNLHKGFNVTILAYGQTGSGKTHTMGTAFNGVLNESVGVIPRAMDYIFSKVEELSSDYCTEVKCSFLELYQEQLYDLLATEKTREQSIVEIREDKNGICIPDLTYEIVKTAQETTNCLMRGSGGRAVASTAMNEHSSRSHAIFTVTLTSTKKNDSRAVTHAKFHLVDLAGSERSKKTKATGDRFKEGVKINHGLLALGNVISALGSDKKAGFVQYRDSKLTRLLQDSLGGNSITLMIACISPADYNSQETLSTLRYADRARKIKNKPIVNQDPHAAEINHLKGIIQKLRLELLSVKGSPSSSMESLTTPINANAVSPKKTCNDKMYRDLQEKYRNLQQKLQKTLHDCMENEMRVHLAEVAHEKLKIKTDEMKIAAEDLAVDIERDETETAGLSEQMKEHSDKVRRLVKMAIDINDELEKTVAEVNEHKQTALNASASGMSGSENETNALISEEGVIEIEQQADVYNNKQFNFKEQLCRINQELNLKEQLQQRLANNLNKFATLDCSIESNRYEEYQKKIRELEDEKADLQDKLQHVKANASAKLAEERRKRLQTLEAELTNMKSKIKQQSNLLKVREKEAQKIENLSREIQAMKQSKVKLIRTMRLEAENFRQWKLKREKELIQMKTKGKRMENEMARKEALHTKQRNVLKRKCEEAMAINKRLKDALERQSAAQAMRQKLQSSKDTNSRRIEHVISVVEREMEVIISLIEAEQSLEHLMEDRGIINARILDLRSNDPESDELQQLEEEYEMRNAQIMELQQKVSAADLDARMQSIGESIQNMAEARAVTKQLVITVCDTRKEYAGRLQEQKSMLDEKRAQLQTCQDECQAAVKKLKMLENQHQEALTAIERAYEEKIALVLSQLGSRKSSSSQAEGEPTNEQNQCLQIEQDLYGKIESMHEQILQYQQTISELQAKQKSKHTKSKVKSIVEEIVILSDIDDDDDDAIFEFEQSDDPDWTYSHPPRRNKRSRNTLRTTASALHSSTSDANQKSFEETYATATSQPNVNGSSDLKHKQITVRRCNCRKSCKTKQCGCRLADRTCGEFCRCGDACTNGKNNMSDSQPPTDADDELSIATNRTYDIDCKENIEIENTVPEKRQKSEFLKPPAPNGSPTITDDHLDENSRKMARLTTINFNTPTSKKKFFN